MEPVGRKIARWIENEDKITDKMNTSRSILVKDRYDELVFLFENEFATRWFEEKFLKLSCIVYFMAQLYNRICYFKNNCFVEENKLYILKEKGIL